MLSSLSSLCFCFLYARILIANKEINYTTNEPYNSGDVATVVLCIVSAIYSISGIAPNFQIIQKKSKMLLKNYQRLRPKLKI